MSMGELTHLRLQIDFNYRGRIANTGYVVLYPKTGDRMGMHPGSRAQFDAAGIEPVNGMVVLLVENRADLNDGGVVCDMQVVSKLE